MESAPCSEADVDTAELVVYLCLLLSAVAIGPLIARHVAGRTEVVEEAVRGMAHTTRFWARLAGTMHLTWFGILLLSSAVLVREYFDPVRDRDRCGRIRAVGARRVGVHYWQTLASCSHPLSRSSALRVARLVGPTSAASSMASHNGRCCGSWTSAHPPLCRAPQLSLPVGCPDELSARADCRGTSVQFRRPDNVFTLDPFGWVRV